MPGPKPGSPGAMKIGEAHRGSHDHDKTGGFAADPKRAADAGKRGGESLLRRKGARYMSKLATKGGTKLLSQRGRAFYSEIGKRGAQKRWEKEREKQAQ